MGRPTCDGRVCMWAEEQPEPAKKKPKASSWVLPTKKSETREKLQTGGVKAGATPAKVRGGVSVAAVCVFMCEWGAGKNRPEGRETRQNPSRFDLTNTHAHAHAHARAHTHTHAGARVHTHTHTNTHTHT